MADHSKEDAYLKRLGGRVLSEANDLKRTPQALAAELGWEPDEVARIIAGNSSVESARQLLVAMADAYPVSLADLWVEPDDTDHGVRVMRAQESAASARVFERPMRDGALAPYYEYRDTAMSSSAPFKPEWIKELRLVDDDDPHNPDVAFNKGHLLHQLTFFIGEVNFYWIVDGEKHCMPMHTGDSCYITPFVPHSFTSRNPDAPGLILAVTYAGKVRGALESLSHYTAAQLESTAASLQDELSAFAARLAKFRDNQSLPIAALSQRLQDAGLAPARADSIAAGKVMASADELTRLADALAVREADLLVHLPKRGEYVVTSRHSATPARNLPDTNRPVCKLIDLAKPRNQPELCGFDLEMLGGDTDAVPFSHGLHEYLFNYGDAPVELSWGDGQRTTTLAPGDSAYVRPTIAHQLRGPAKARVAMMRVPGTVGDDVLHEYSTYAAEGRSRVAGETTRWF